MGPRVGERGEGLLAGREVDARVAGVGPAVRVRVPEAHGVGVLGLPLRVAVGHAAVEVGALRRVVGRVRVERDDRAVVVPVGHRHVRALRLVAPRLAQIVRARALVHGVPFSGPSVGPLFAGAPRLTPKIRPASAVSRTFLTCFGGRRGGLPLGGGEHRPHRHPVTLREGVAIGPVDAAQQGRGHAKALGELPAADAEAPADPGDQAPVRGGRRLGGSTEALPPRGVPLEGSHPGSECCVLAREVGHRDKDGHDGGVGQLHS